MKGIEISKITASQSKKTEPIRNANAFLNILNKDISFSGGKLSDKKKEKFYSELQVLIAAGVDIKTVLEIIEEQHNKQKDRDLFNNIKEKVINGSSLSEAMEKEKNIFSDYEIFSLRIGEESGRMSEVLLEQANYFSKKIKQKRQLVQAITYPSLVVSVAIGAVYFMLRFIVPMLQDMFKRFGGELPYMTKMVIKASDFVVAYGLLILLLFLLIGIVFYSQRHTIWFRKTSASFVLKIPFLGNILKKIYLARFCQSMNLLLNARTRLVHALELVNKMVGFYPIEKSLQQIVGEVEKGQSLYKSLSQYEIYPSHLISLIKIAEEVNKLDEMFGRLAKQYSDEVEHEMGLLSSVLEPVIMIFLGFFVIIILVAMYLPMFQMGMGVH